MQELEVIQSQASRFQEPTRIPENLPLLSQLRLEMPRADFSRYSFLLIQHFLAPFPPRLDLMLKDGLDPVRTWFLDIPYSTNAEVRERIGDLFVDRVPNPYTNPFGHYNLDQEDRLAAVLEAVLDRLEEKRLVVVDDGAHFAKFLHRLLVSEPRKANRFLGARLVEQTTRGHWFLESPEGQETLRDLEIRAVSVARTETKVRVEAPFVGVAIAGSVVGALERRRATPRRVLVLGFGSIGSATSFALRSTFPEAAIDVVEINQMKLDRAQSMGFTVRQALTGHGSGCAYDLVVGCTGHRTFHPTDRGLLANDALLASGSSAAVEFDRRNFVDQADARKDDDFEVVTRREGPLPLHTDIVFRHGSRNKVFTILNAGFPVDFQGSLGGSVPTELIEPTHCLLHAATLEVMGASRVGLTHLSRKWDNRIYEMARSVIHAGDQYSVKPAHSPDSAPRRR